MLRHFHLIKRIIGKGDVTLERVDSQDNIADPFTKALTQQQFDRHLEKMGIRYHGDWL